MLYGVQVKPLKSHFDDRGSFTELMREDWQKLVRDNKIVQANLSVTHPGIIRAWHQHSMGQIDYMICLGGTMKICIFNEKHYDNAGELDEIISTSQQLQVVSVPGLYWHGFKALGNKSAWLVYFVTKLYDYENPDETHIPWNDPRVVPNAINGKKDDPRVGKPWNWNLPPHR